MMERLNSPHMEWQSSICSKGANMVGVKDVAARAGVSISTVSYALSGRRPISAETKAKVIQAMRELGYRPKGMLQAWQGEHTGIIAVSSPMDDDTAYRYWSPFIFSITKRARHYGYTVLLSVQEKDGAELTRIAVSGGVDGVVLLDVSLDDPRVAVARTSRIPVVAIGFPRHRAGIVAVDLDFEKAGNEALKRLQGLGHRNILFIGAEVTSYLDELNFLIRTRDAIMTSAQQLNISVIFSSMRGGSQEDATRVIDQAFQRNSGITAVVVQQGQESWQPIMYALHRRALAVPQDVSVIVLSAFGDAVVQGQGLDEIPVRPSQTCSHAVDVLHEWIEGNSLPPEEGRVDLVPVTYLRRGSVAEASSR